MHKGTGSISRSGIGRSRFAPITLSVAAVALLQTSALQAATTITVEGDNRVIVSDAVPNHETGQFPNRENPNRMRPQNYKFRIPVSPKISETTTVLRMAPFGIAMNGIVFDPFAAEWWDRNPATGWQYEPMSGSTRLGIDANNAHVQPDGAYHYHGIPTGLTNALGEVKEPVMLGYAADGFPIYGPFGYKDAKDARSEIVKLRSSYRVRQGTRPNGPGGTYDGSFVEDYVYVPGAGDLDECNGRFGVTPQNPAGTYHYILTDSFPYVPRVFKGTPDESFMRRGRQGGPPGRGHTVAGRGGVEGESHRQFEPGMPPQGRRPGHRRTGGADMADQDFMPPHPPHLMGSHEDDQSDSRQEGPGGPPPGLFPPHPEQGGNESFHRKPPGHAQSDAGNPRRPQSPQRPQSPHRPPDHDSETEHNAHPGPMPQGCEHVPPQE